MNARVLLLVLVTGLFMAAWNSDQTAMEAAIVRRDIRIERARLALLHKENSEVKTVAVSNDADKKEVSHSLTVAPVSDSATNASVCNEKPSSAVPLPSGIAAGEYQAVNQDTGATEKLSVTASAGNETARDFYTVDDKQGDRWYLIRIAATDATQL